jgi:hypothetical protein
MMPPCLVPRVSQYNTDTVRVGLDVHRGSTAAVVRCGNDTGSRIERPPGDRRNTDRLEAEIDRYAISEPLRATVEALC